LALKFQPGDIAIAKFDVDFCDGSKHRVGQRIVVTEENVSYYNVCHLEYDKEINKRFSQAARKIGMVDSDVITRSYGGVTYKD